MTDVRSGSVQPVGRGVAARGIATVWVAADSAENAMQRGREVLDSRHYARTGELSVFREESNHVDSESLVDPRDGLAEAYVAIKGNALRERNGLFEIWFPPLWN